MFTVYVGGWNQDFSNLIMTHIHMPESEDAIKHALSDIGVDIDNGGDYRIQSFSSAYVDLMRCLNNSDDIWELNTLARVVSELDELDRMKLGAACVLKKCDGAAEALKLAANLDRFEYLPAENDEALGGLELETDRWNVPDGLNDYIDCAKLGRETRLRQGGAFVGIGYIYEIGDEVMEQGGTGNFAPPSGMDTQDGNWSDSKRELITRMRSEYNIYAADMLGKSPQIIIDSAYDIYIMSNLVHACESELSDERDIAILLTLENPLESLHDGWRRTDFSIIDTLISINETIRQRKQELTNGGSYKAGYDYDGGDEFER